MSKLKQVRNKGVIVVLKKSYGVVLMIMLAVALTVGGCGPQQQAPGTSQDQGKPVKIGVLPIEDNLPFYVAEQDGFFGKAGVNVQLVPFTSAQERDVALQAGQIDGEVADLVAVGLIKKAGTDIKIAAIGMGATPKEGRFAILSSPNSKIKKPQDLKNVEIGVSENSIIDYVTDQMLGDAKLTPAEIKKMPIPNMPVRKDMLLANKIEAACLPDPLATLAVAQGAQLVVDDTYRNVSQTVILFRAASIKSNLQGIKAVVKVYGDAGQALTKEPERYRNLVIEKAKIPDPLKSSYPVPTFSALRLPSEEEVNSVMQWMVNKKLLPAPYPYQELVNPSLLPTA